MVHVVPRAARSEVVGLHGDAIKLRIAAPPVDGAANDEVIRFVATILGVPKRRVTIETGTTGRRKVVVIEGLEPMAVAEKLGLGPSGDRPPPT